MTLSTMRLILSLAILLAAAFAADPIVLPPVTVSSTTAELRPFALTGEPVGFLDTPRSYLSIELDQTTRFTDLNAFTSSIQIGGTYGATSTVNVRGDMAELYQNGQRRTNNAAGFQPSFNGVEQVDVVKGAAPVVFGPGFYSGGYLNLQTKRAHFAPVTIVGATLGTLSADHSYLNVTGSVDTNVPLTQTTALRVSYEGRRDRTFYRAGRDDAQDVYLTLHRALPGSTLDLSLEHLWQAIPQIEGINRPTQTLIWTREYDAMGAPRRLAPGDNLVSAGDFSNANVTTAQGVYTQGTSFRSYSLVESVARRRFNAFSYAEYVRQLTADQRFEWHWESDLSYLIVGAEARYERRESYTNYFNAAFGAYDVTLPGPRDATLLPDYVMGIRGPGGRPFFGPLDGNADTTRSHLYQVAPFLQHRIRWSNWQVLYGLRADGYRAFVTDPLTRSVSDDLTTYSASRTASLIRTMGHWSLYATYARLYSVNGTVSGGGIVLAPDMRIDEGNLRSLNRLYEVGLKRQTHVGQFSVTAFSQARQQPDLYAYKPNDIVVRGVEVESSWRRRGLSATHSVTYQEGSFRNSLPFELPSPTLASVSAPGDYRIPGLSRWYATAAYTLAGKRWSTTLMPRWQSEQSGTGLGGYHIPSQTMVNASVAYGRPGWSVRLDVRNALNQWLWVHNADSFGSTVVVHHEPLLNAQLSFRLTR